MKLLREPLLHFVIVGAILFAAHAWWSRDGDAGTKAVEAVTITDGDLRWMAASRRGQWLREPWPAEIQAMIAGLVEEELLAREALEMGLEQDDTVVRRRLARKLAFLVEDTSRLVALHGNDPAAAHLGDSLLVEGDFRDLDRVTIASIFGPEFADAVLALAPGSWSGPIASGYGQHRVFVSATAPAKARSFDDVRDMVAAERWREKETAARRDSMALLRAKYSVEMDPAVLALLDGAAAPDMAQR